jgi:hypothetical protein
MQPAIMSWLMALYPLSPCGVTLRTRCEWRAVQTMTNNFLRVPTQRSPEGFVKLLPAPGDWTPLVMEQP